MNAINHIGALVASLDYAAFGKAITNACKVVERRAPVPILSTVLVSAARGGMQVCGTDLDRYTTTFVAGAVDPGFTCLLDAHKVMAVMKKAKSSSTVNLSLHDGRVVMSIGKLYITMEQKLELADFPAAADFRDELKASNCSFVLKAETLTKVLDRVAFAVSTEETRYYLNGVFMHNDGSHLAFVTTDGHRLARYRIGLPAGAGALPDCGVIVPRTTVEELLRLTKRKDCPADIHVTASATGISFLLGDDELLESKVIDGTFPDYNRVIPANNEHRLDIMPSLLIEAVTQASTVSTERGRAVKLELGDGWLRASCRDPEFGIAEMRVAAENETPLTIGFNCSYLLSILARVEGKAQFQFATQGDPVVILDADDAGVTYCQMPMRV